MPDKNKNNKRKMVISREMKETIQIEQEIISGYIVHKTRSEDLMKKYEGEIKEESEIPVNRFLRWTTIINPYIEAVISTKITDGLLIKRYQEFIKKLIEHNFQNIVRFREIEIADENLDFLLSKIFKLENKILKYKQDVKLTEYNKPVEEPTPKTEEPKNKPLNSNDNEEIKKRRDLLDEVINLNEELEENLGSEEKSE